MARKSRRLAWLCVVAWAMVAERVSQAASRPSSFATRSCPAPAPPQPRPAPAVNVAPRTLAAPPPSRRPRPQRPQVPGGARACSCMFSSWSPAMSAPAVSACVVAWFLRGEMRDERRRPRTSRAGREDRLRRRMDALCSSRSRSSCRRLLQGHELLIIITMQAQRIGPPLHSQVIPTRIYFRLELLLVSCSRLQLFPQNCYFEFEICASLLELLGLFIRQGQQLLLPLQLLFKRIVFDNICFKLILLMNCFLHLCNCKNGI